MLEIGINSNNECGRNLNEVLTNIKNAGFNNVMLAMKAGNYEDQIKLTLSKGLKIPFIHLNNRYANDLWAKGESNTNYIADVIYQLELCAKYKIKVAVMHPTEGGASDLALPPNEQGLISMNKILKAAQKLKVKIALENLDNLNFKNFKYLMDNINHPYFGLCYDMGHHQLYKPNFDILKNYGSKILAVHLHDNLMDWQYGYDYTRDLHRLPFDGKLNYPASIKKLAATPYKNVVMLELHKDSCGAPRLYDNLSVSEFLAEAKARGEKLAKMLEEYRK